MFPKIMGTTKATDRPYYAYGSQSQGLKKGESALGSVKAPGTAISTNPNSITYTKTFEVQRTDSDEQELVQIEMNEYGSRKVKPQSSSTSVSSL